MNECTRKFQNRDFAKEKKKNTWQKWKNKRDVNWHLFSVGTFSAKSKREWEAVDVNLEDGGGAEGDVCESGGGQRLPPPQPPLWRLHSNTHTLPHHRCGHWWFDFEFGNHFQIWTVFGSSDVSTSWCFWRGERRSFVCFFCLAKVQTNSQLWIALWVWVDQCGKKHVLPLNIFCRRMLQLFVTMKTYDEKPLLHKQMFKYEKVTWKILFSYIG